MKRIPLVFVVLMLSWLSQTSVIAQVENEQQAIDVLIKVSKQIEANQQANPQKLIDDAWKPISSALKAKSSVLYAYALVRLANNLESYTYFNRLSILSPDDYRVKKAHIYSAFKDKGGVSACTLISKYVRPNLNNVDPAPELKEFLLWASVVIESISAEEPIEKKLKVLIESEQYDVFKQANAKDLQPLLEAAGIDLKQLNFNAAKNLDDQIRQAKQLLKQTADQYSTTREAVVLAYQQLRSVVQMPTLVTLWMPVRGGLKGPVYITPDLVYGFDIEVVEIGIVRGTYKSRYPTFNKPYWCFTDSVKITENNVLKKDGDGPYYLAFESTHRPLELKQYLAACSRIKPQIDQLLTLKGKVQTLDSQMIRFLTTFSSNFKEAIKADVELTQAVVSWRQRLSQFNAQFSMLATLDAKQQAIEKKTLKLLGNSLLPKLQFTPKDELAKLEAN